LKRQPKKYSTPDKPHHYLATRFVKLLTKREIDIIKLYGSRLTIFIHGYNVPVGEPGHYIAKIDKEPVNMAPYDANHPDSIWSFKESPYPRTVGLEIQNVELSYKKFEIEFPEIKKISERFKTYLKQVSNPDLNMKFPGEINGNLFNKILGSGAEQWFNQMEYNLNRAAGFDGLNWENYTRILRIHWQGDVGEKNFGVAQDNAKITGKDDKALIPLLKQLKAHDIKVTIIAHSLGNAFLMHTLEHLGKNNMYDLNLIELPEELDLNKAYLNASLPIPTCIKQGKEFFVWGKVKNSSGFLENTLTHLSPDLGKIKSLKHQFSYQLKNYEAVELDSEIYKEILLYHAHRDTEVKRKINSPVNHAILWEAAVQRTAFEKQDEYYYDLRMNDDYQFAHKGAKKISILNSPFDTVLENAFSLSQHIGKDPLELWCQFWIEKVFGRSYLHEGKINYDNFRRKIGKAKIETKLRVLPEYQAAKPDLKEKYRNILENYYLENFILNAYGREDIPMQAACYTQPPPPPSKSSKKQGIEDSLAEFSRKVILVLNENIVYFEEDQNSGDDDFKHRTIHCENAKTIFKNIIAEFKEGVSFPQALGLTGLPDTDMSEDWRKEKIQAAKLIEREQLHLKAHSHMRNPSPALFNSIFCEYIVNLKFIETEDSKTPGSHFGNYTLQKQEH
ncbi:MAG: hypothetical protein ACKOAD_01155, partial [Gammaproteobacteria bacterium]